MKKVFLSLVLFVTCTSFAQAQQPTKEIRLDSTVVKPTGAYNDTIYFDAVFAFQGQLLKVDYARYIVEYITFPTYNQPLRDYWEVQVKKKWARVENGSQRLVWARRNKK
jgi:hypothetical protein